MNQRYNAGREAFGEGRINWVRDDVVAYLVSAKYRFSVAHKTVQSLSGIVSGPVLLEKKKITDGYASAGQLMFGLVRSEDEIVALVLAKRDSTLIAYLDEVEGFPLRSSGLDIAITLPKDKPYFFRA